MAAKKKQEDEERRTRARRMEARLQKEEAARLKREHAREHRRKEREAREQSAKAVTSMSVSFLSPLTVPCSPLSSPERQPEDAGSSTSHHSTDYPRDHKIEGELGLSRSSTRTPVGDWELCCEICHRQGVNIVCQRVTLFFLP